MLLAFGPHLISTQSLSSKTELLKSLAQSPNSILLGEDNAEDEFYLTTIHFPCEENQHFSIGIYAENHGIKPTLLLLPNQDLILFGYHQEITGINVKNRHLAFQIKLDSLFFYFWHLSTQEIVLIIQELGVLAITESGKELGRYQTKDIITNTHLPK